MSDTSRMILRTWEQEAQEGQAYRLTVRAQCPADLSLPLTAVLEWWASPDASESGTSGDLRPHKRIYLNRDSAGWSDVHVAPPRTRRMRVLLNHWHQLGPVPLGTWDFVCEPTEVIPPQTFKAAVAYQQTDPLPPQTMEARRNLTVATIEQAGREKAKLLVLSENFFDRGITTPLTERALALNDPWLEPIYAAIRSARLHAVFAYHEKNGDRIYNCAVLVSPQGQVIGTYRKRHLTQMELEIGLTPGESWPVFDTPWAGSECSSAGTAGSPTAPRRWRGAAHRSSVSPWPATVRKTTGNTSGKPAPWITKSTGWPASPATAAE